MEGPLMFLCRHVIDIVDCSRKCAGLFHVADSEHEGNGGDESDVSSDEDAVVGEIISKASCVAWFISVNI
jgi:hypothetical protein